MRELKRYVKAQKDMNGLKTIVRNLPDNLFDGHTEFSALKPDQRLAWLSGSVRFAWEAQKTKQKK